MMLGTTPGIQPIATPQPMTPLQSMTPLQPMAPVQPPKPWKIKFPAIISGILSFLQFGITFVIIGCEVGSVLIDMVTATIYVGFWASLFFIFAWISQATTSCCCRNRGCATYTLIMQVISLFFAACVIGFDSYYIIYPTTCFFSSSICNGLGTTRGLFYTYSNFYNIKIPLIKGQLAAGAVMFVLCLISIGIYIITTIRVYRAAKRPIVYPQTTPYSVPPYSMPPLPTGPDGMVIAPPALNVRPPKPGSPLYHRPMIILDNGEGRTNDLVCPTCSTMMNVSVRKKPPQ
ncbi:unnamed protein product [Adineta steineri]|uniref:Uncharacterized protein n=3 Tax=Adineta steineri TaxID=433720 RepID=A0A814U2S7_9BILA|nr:unnamed protein product [Adineta steineri]CAF1168045.1 unnamed protein product [Adineta steineri]CAF1229228.1 unnamed protein product [Adineta steineri]